MDKWEEEGREMEIWKGKRDRWTRIFHEVELSMSGEDHEEHTVVLPEKTTSDGIARSGRYCSAGGGGGH